MKTIFTFLLIALSLNLFYAQTDSSKDSVPTFNQQGNNIGISDPVKGSKANPETQNSSESNTQVTINGMSSDSAVKRLNLYVPEFYVGPMSNTKRIPTTFILENEYSYNNYHPLGERAGLSTISSLNIYPGLGAVNTIGGSVGYRLSDWWDVSAGSYISKYSIYGNSFNDIGLNGSMKFHLNDRFSINTFGQYSIYGDKKQMVGGNFPGMFPQSYYGGTLEYKINEKFGIQGGMVRELDPMTGKWKNIPVIAPVFYGK